MRTHTNTQFKPVSTLSQIRVASGPRAHQPALLLTAIATFLAIVGLSSCAGYTSAAKTGPGTTSGAGVLSASSTALSFGDVAVANSATQTLTLTNTGTGTVDISQATLSGAAFSVVGGTPSGTLQVGQSASMQVQFAPTNSGAASGIITVTSDASDPTVTVALSGTGAQAGLAVSPATWSFGNTTVGQTTSANVKLTNTGNSNVTINLATVNGSAFGMSGLTFPMTLNAGQSATFAAQFTPTANGAASGSISFTDNAPNSPQTLTMSGTGVATSSTLAASPATVSFGSVAVGSNGQQNITLTNSGNASATISSISASGAGFSVSGLSTPVTVAANQTVNFSAQFAPTTAGAASGSITISSTANNSTLSIPLSGSGVQGSLTANPGAVSFNNVNVGSSGSSTVTLTNSGSASISISQASVSGAGFTITGLSTPATIAAGQSTSFTAKFAPTTAGSANGNISITSNAPNSPLSIGLTGTGVATQAQLTVTPGSVNFGNANVGGSASATVSLSNQGNATLTVSQISASGTGFSVSGAGTPLNIAPGSTASFTATFAPTSAGSATGSISIVSNAPGSPASVALTGTGTQAQLGASPSNVTFGSVAVGSNGSQTVTLTNGGSASLTISQATASGSGFTITGISTPLNLGAGQSTSFTAQFAPTTGGNASGTISIVSNAPNSPLTIAMSGTGTTPQVSASPSNVTFGSVAVGSNGSQTVTLTNGGSASLTISQASASGTGFTISGISTPLKIAAGQSASFTAQFAPTSGGNASGSITIVSNAPNSPLTIAMTGSGTSPQISVTPSSAAFGNVSTGTNNSQTITISNGGSASLTLSSVSVTGAGFSFTGISAPLTIAAGKNASFNAVFAPTVSGAASGSITIANNSPTPSINIPLSGTGIASTKTLGLSTTSLNFGSVNVGSSNSLSVAVTNTGNANVTISNVATSGSGFSVTGVSNGEMLTPNQSITVTVQFAPTAGGAVTGNVVLTSDASNSPSTITTSGTGVASTPHSVALNWTASTGSNIAGYNVYRGTTANGPYPTKVNTSGLVDAVQFTDNGVTSGQTYYYVVTAVDTSNDESAFSNQASAIIP